MINNKLPKTMLEKNSYKALYCRLNTDSNTSWFNEYEEQPWIFGRMNNCSHDSICVFTGFYDATSFKDLTKPQRDYCCSFYKNASEFTEQNFKGIPIFEHDIVWFKENGANGEPQLKFGYVEYIDGGLKIVQPHDFSIEYKLNDFQHKSNSLNIYCMGNIHIRNDVAATEDYFKTIWSDITYKHKIVLTIYACARLTADKNRENPDTGDMSIHKWHDVEPNNATLFTTKTIVSEDEGFAANELAKYLNFGDFIDQMVTSWNHETVYDYDEYDDIKADYIISKFKYPNIDRINAMTNKFI